MVHAQVRLVHIVAAHRRRDEIREWNVAIGERIERGDRAANRALYRRGNGIARERLPGQEIYWSVEQRLRKVAIAFCGGRHITDFRDAFAQIGVFVVGKEEGVIRDNWPPDRAAKLMPVVIGRRRVFRREMIAGVEMTIAEKFIPRPRELVGPRRGDHIYLSAGVPSERGVVGRGEHLEL